MSDHDEGIAVLVPAYNEAKTIGNIVQRCLKQAPLVLVVDDGSSDTTALEAERNGAIVLRNAKNSGLGASLRQGFSYLLQNKIRCVVTVDGDGVHQPEYIPDLVRRHLDTGVDLTIGSRFMKPEFSLTVPSSKLAANRFATTLMNYSLSCSLTDVASGMRAFGERMLGSSLVSNGFSIAYETISVVLLCHTDSPVELHPASTRRKGAGGSSSRRQHRH